MRDSRVVRIAYGKGSVGLALDPKAAQWVVIRPKFEEALARVEKIVEELEGGDLTLDESLAKYEDGVKTLKTCYEILRDAEKRVEVLLQGENGALQTAPWEADAAAEQPDEAGSSSSAEESEEDA